MDFLCKLSTVISNAALCGVIGLRKNIQIEFPSSTGLIARLRAVRRPEWPYAVIVSCVIAQGMAQLRRHQAGVAHAGEQVIEAGNQFVATGERGGVPGADATAQGDKLFAAHFFNEPFVAFLR
jgi:hypothetical protein